MNRLFYITLLLTMVSCSPPRVDPDKQEWERIFNGKDLTGWDVKIAGYDLNDNYNRTFRVEDSVLKVDYSRYNEFEGKFGHIYYNKPYSYYAIRLEYMFEGNQLKGAPDWGYLNSGIMLHSQPASSVNKNQTFPVSLEMQLLASDEEHVRPTGNLCTPGTQVYIDGQLIEDHCINSNTNDFPRDVWMTAEAIVLGDSIIYHIIGKDTCLTYQHPVIGGGFVGPDNTWTMAGITDSLHWINKAGSRLAEGYVALQAESQPVNFRNIEILNLKGCTDRKARNFKSYYVKSDNSTCIY